MRFKLLVAHCFVILIPAISNCLAQQNSSMQDSTINNLVLPFGYKTRQPAALVDFKKYGTGEQALILIPGLGFDASVFDDFMEANKSKYTMYAITIPGYGKTLAPPMPPEGTSYGDQTWNSGVIQGLVKLIEKEKIQKPVIVGHFVQGTQLALRMAIEYPEKVGGVIILGGPAKFIVVMKGQVRDFPLDTMILYTDKYTGPKWFKHMKKNFFDDNNFLPEIYSLDSLEGKKLWKKPSEVPLPVMVRYVSEYFACDVKPRIDRIHCPVLVLRATFDEKVLQNPVNNYIVPQFIDSWNDVSERNSCITVKDIKAASFVWKDQPATVYKEIREFLYNIH